MEAGLETLQNTVSSRINQVDQAVDVADRPELQMIPSAGHDRESMTDEKILNPRTTGDPQMPRWVQV